MLSLDNVTKRFVPNTPPAVDALSLDVPRVPIQANDGGEAGEPGKAGEGREGGGGGGGGATALIGPSGCGKSTILRLMIGLITPSDGTVRFHDNEMKAGDWRVARKNFGYAIQSGGLFPHMTARDNAALPARHWRVPKTQRDERVNELAALVHLPQDALDRFPSELSGGQRQRVALMRALVMDPEILLLDEPLGALDPIIRAELQQELRGLITSLNKTVVLVTHDLAEAAYLCADDIVLLRDGKVAQRGSFDDLVRAPASDFVSRFINAQAERVRTLAGVAG